MLDVGKKDEEKTMGEGWTIQMSFRFLPETIGRDRTYRNSMSINQEAEYRDLFSRALFVAVPKDELLDGG